jgi:hypothetical protein
VYTPTSAPSRTKTEAAKPAPCRSSSRRTPISAASASAGASTTNGADSPSRPTCHSIPIHGIHGARSTYDHVESGRSATASAATTSSTAAMPRAPAIATARLRASNGAIAPRIGHKIKKLMTGTWVMFHAP